MNSAPIIAPLPTINFEGGQVTWHKLRRSALVYASFYAIALCIFLVSTQSHWHAFALGLMWPGAGFLSDFSAQNWHGLIFAFAGFSLFMGGLFLWFATGNAIAPSFIWLCLALMAAARKLYSKPICSSTTGNHWFIAGLILAIILLMLLVAIAKRVIGKRQRQQTNDYLNTIAPTVAEQFNQNNDNLLDDSTPKELSLADLKHMRFLLDRALQPVENFEGFDWIDQFQTAAVRYQLNFLGYALSLAQARFCPAFGGYLDDAQRNLITKQTDYRIWRYWRLENWWGNFSANANPIIRDNIMYTGFCATQIAMFHAASGSNHFLQKSRFTPQSTRLQFPSNLAGLIETINNGFKKSSFYLIACEPNWVYPLCNIICAAAVKAHDASLWAQHQATFLQHLEQEFITPKGLITPCKSSYTGLAFPAIGGALPQALTCFFLNATFPTIALRQWLLLRKNIYNNHHLNRKYFWPIDTGNYGLHRGAAYAGTALAAIELGDNEVADLCLDALKNEYPITEINGVTHRPNVSVWAHALEFLARCNVKNGFKNLLENPAQSRQHPFIAQLNYPQVLVAHASYQHEVLKAVFYNGTQPSLQRIVIANLQPHARYICHAKQTQQISANADGIAVLTLWIEGRTAIAVIAESAAT